MTDHSLWPRWSPKSLAADDVVLATAVDSHVQGVQSHSGSLQDLINISRFQSYERVLHIVFYVLKFISNLKQASGRSCGSHHCPSAIDLAIPVSTAAEISQAEVTILRAHQIQHFRQEREFLFTEETPPTFRKFKVALNPMYRIFLNFAKSCVLSCLSKVENIKKFHRVVFES